MFLSFFHIHIAFIYSFTILIVLNASKVCTRFVMEKITSPPLIHTSALKIVPLHVRVYTVGSVERFDIAVFCSS